MVGLHTHTQPPTEHTNAFNDDINRVFINEFNLALAYNFGQKASYDLGHVAKMSYIYMTF